MIISIITTSYKSETTIKNTIDSVLSQTYNNIEYIIIDGASKDSTISIIKEYEHLFNGNLKYVSEPDKGIYDAMNKGISMATGDVIGILNSDDFFTSNDIIEKIVNCFEDNDIDAVYGDIHFVKDSDLNKSVRYYSSKIFNPKLFRFGFMPAHPSFYCKKECYEKYGLYSLDYKLAADFDLLLRFINKNKIKTKYLPLDFVTMRTGGASTKNLKSRLTLNKENIKACRMNGIYTNVFFVSLKYLYKIFEYSLH